MFIALDHGSAGEVQHHMRFQESIQKEQLQFQITFSPPNGALTRSLMALVIGMMKYRVEQIDCDYSRHKSLSLTADVEYLKNEAELVDLNVQIDGSLIVASGLN